MLPLFYNMHLWSVLEYSLPREEKIMGRRSQIGYISSGIPRGIPESAIPKWRPSSPGGQGVA